MQSNDQSEIVVVGAGYAGIATAFSLATRYGRSSVRIVDPRPPMSYTSAQSGDNYRNWWPHPTMTAFTDWSIDLLEELALESGNVFNMTRRGYLLATRDADVSPHVDSLVAGYGDPSLVRLHTSASRYEAPAEAEWESAPTGVDVLADTALIKRAYPQLAPDIRHVVHIRRAGDLSGQQLGQYLLERFRDAGGRRQVASIEAIDSRPGGFELTLREHGETKTLEADVLVNAAGPYAADVARMLDVTLPVTNVFQQKIAFEDVHGAVKRTQPFTIDLDPVRFEWSNEEREFLAADPATAWLCETIVGGVHCRPEGGDGGTWVKLGWAFNRAHSKPLDDLDAEPGRHDQFPEIVLRGAARLLPALNACLDDFPRRFSHYGGYYTMTEENWPLIGPLGVDNAYIVGALSGFGSMAAPAAGALCAAWIAGEELPAFAADLSPARHENERLMSELRAASSKGLL